MSVKIDKVELAQKINALEGLDNETKAQLLELLHDRKKYGLVWEDKPEDVEERLREELPVLIEDKSKAILSEDEDAPNHILIEGDNLEALTSLSYTHEGKIDVIYIDPPYNTGNKDFVYNDKFVDTEDEYRHSKWLSFMAKRLKIAKRLLSDQGVIFISIDDNEYADLKLLCDSSELLGEEHYVTTLHVEMSATQGMKVKAAQNGTIVKNAEYILIYSKDGHKNIAQNLLYDYRPEFDSHYSKMIINGELVNLKDIFHQQYPNIPLGDITKMYRKYDEFQEFVHTNVANIYADDKISGYELLDYPEGKVYVVQSDDREYYIYNNGNKIRQLLPLINSFGECDDFENSFGLRKIRGDYWKDFYKDMGNVSKEGDVVFNNGKKPVRLIVQIIKMAASPNSIILDFFAGSGTTLHATSIQNDKDKGNRQCILVTSAEQNIAENITYARCKNVIYGYTQHEGLKHNTLRYYRTGFVARESSATAKRELMYASADMLCIKNDIYTEQKQFGTLRLRKDVARYFADGNKGMLVIYNPDAIETIVAELKTMEVKTPIITYIFSLNDYAMDADFEEVTDKVKLCALPAAILNAYYKVLPKRKRKENTL